MNERKRTRSDPVKFNRVRMQVEPTGRRYGWIPASMEQDVVILKNIEGMDCGE